MGEMVLSMIFDVVWPPKGIIYMEEQILQWGFAWLLSYSEKIVILAIILFGIGMLIYSAHLSRYFRGVRSGAERFGQGLFRALRNVIFAWWFLIVGAVRGTVSMNEPCRRRTSLHYRFGRWLYRMMYLYVFRFIHAPRVREIVARVAALVIILWGVWEIPSALGLIV